MAFNGYSAKVSLKLLIGDRSLALSHVGPRHIVVQEECQPLPGGNAQLVIKVDESEKKYPVFLPHGVPGARELVEFF